MGNSGHKRNPLRARLQLLRELARPNTFKTTCKFLLTLLRPHWPFTRHHDRLEDIYNYLPLGQALATSGQPTETQFAAIRQAGYSTVINLAPAQAENALPNEAMLLEKLGFEYIHIPVDFKRPAESDFEQFTEAMQAHSGQKLWVHCAANMRVSAFIYRYRCQVLGIEEEHAERDLNRIWTPFGAWKQFIKART